MHVEAKRKLTFATIAFFFLCGGVEYGVIFPTIWAYLQNLGARDETFLGLAVAAFSMSGIVIGPAIGKWFDKTRNAKAALIVANMFEIIGSFMYFLAVSPWFVVLSRFVCGIGSGASAVVLADVSLNTVIEDRTSILSKLSACRQVGLMTGPVFNIMLQQLDFDIWNFPVNQMTSPGLFMAALGILLECLFVFAYFNLGTLNEQERLAPSRRDSDPSVTERLVAGDQGTMSINTEPSSILVEDNPDLRRAVGDVRTSNSNGMIEVAEDFIANSSSLEAPIVNFAGIQSGSFESPLSPSRFQKFVEDFLHHEVVIILGLTFISYFAQTSFETIVTPLTQKLFSFGAYENSLLFLCCGLEILLSFLAVAALSKRFEDRQLILVGTILLTFAMAWFLYFVPQSIPGDQISLYYFAVGIFLDLLGISMLIACSVSLFSKLIGKDCQGFGQGLRRSWGFAGTILGPLWGGALVARPVILFAVPLGLSVIMMALFVLSYVDIGRRTVNMAVEQSRVIDERSPLIENRR